jgi:hypothetical protein
MPYQTAPSPPMTPELRAACADAMHVVRADGTLLRGAAATLHLFEAIGYRAPARLLGVRPLIWGLEAGYGLVARNRPLFGKFLFTREDPEAEQWVVEGK